MAKANEVFGRIAVGQTVEVNLARALAAAQTASVAPGDDAFVLDVAAKDDIEQQAEGREGKEDGDPGERFDGITVFRHNDSDYTDYSHRISNGKEPVYPGEIDVL